MRRPLLVLLAVLAGCGGGAEPALPPTTTAEPEEEAVALALTPAGALRACRRFPVLARSCPTLVPEAPFEPGSPIYQAGSHAGYPNPGAWVFNLQWGGEHPGRPELDRPPATVHVVVQAGDLPPRRARRSAQARDGLMEKRRRGYIRLGRATWGGRRGVLLLAPPYPLGGIEGNHLVFRWREGGADYEISLHGWEPFTEVVPALRAVVRSIPASS